MFRDGYRDGYEEGKRQAQTDRNRDLRPPISKVLMYGGDYVASYVRGVDQGFRDTKRGALK